MAFILMSTAPGWKAWSGEIKWKTHRNSRTSSLKEFPLSNISSSTNSFLIFFWVHPPISQRNKWDVIYWQEISIISILFIENISILLIFSWIPKSVGYTFYLCVKQGVSTSVNKCYEKEAKQLKYES